MSKKYKINRKFMFEGKPIYIHANTEREYIEKKTRKMIELESGSKRLNSAKILVHEWAEDCFDQYKTDVKPITLESQKGKVRKWVLPEIGNMRVKDVEQYHIQKILNNMQGKGQNTIDKVYQLTRFIFEKAKQNHIINENPCDYVTRPKGTQRKGRPATKQEIEHVLKVAEEEPQFTFYLFMLFCGLRPSEVANLKGADIKIVQGEHILHVEGTKTSTAVRDIPIPSYLYERIPETKPFDYIFTNNEGRPLTRGNRERLCRAFKRALNISMGCKVYRNELVPPYPLAPDFKPYCLRHSYCSNLYEDGVDIRTTQIYMGHKNFDVTAEVYTHMSETKMIETAKTIEKISRKVVEKVAPEVAPQPQPVAIADFM